MQKWGDQIVALDIHGDMYIIVIISVGERTEGATNFMGCAPSTATPLVTYAARYHTNHTWIERAELALCAQCWCKISMEIDTYLLYLYPDKI